VAENAIVSAGSVVTKDVPPNATVQAIRREF
jgi:acetyltransferase-like isoleucine patch superfamily enzyme